MLPKFLLLFLTITTLETTKILASNQNEYTISSKNLQAELKKYNEELRVFNHFGAELAWNMSTDIPNSASFLGENEEMLVKKNLWNNNWCIKLLNFNSAEFSAEESRQIYLICRGPRFSSYQLSNVLTLLSKLRQTYDTHKTCVTEDNCLRMEPELNNLMEKSRNEKLLKSAWEKWHGFIGSQLSEEYYELVKLLNIGARQAGHTDIGSCWREELEMENVKKKTLELYDKIKYLYSLLHSYVRFKLENFYKIDLGSGAIPAHLLGNMWSQKWDSLMDIVWPSKSQKGDESKLLIQKLIGKNNPTVKDMVSFAEFFYKDMGFPPFTKEFFKNSYFEDEGNKTKNCHGSAANMYEKNDFRIMMCADVKDSDLQTLIHEMGHIQYFMAYENLPTVFQDGANSAFHEAVGDAVTYGLHKNPSLKTLLKLGLSKLPQIAFGLVVDMWRWRVFENENKVGEWNDYWWELNREFLGIRVPDGYKTNGFDALGKYHIVDNIPYIRYFYASFLQHMFYGAMCENGEVYCDLSGKGTKFRSMLKRGTSAHWSKILEDFTGESEISATALLKYYEPLKTFLENEVQLHNIPVGWK